MAGSCPATALAREGQWPIVCSRRPVAVVTSRRSRRQVGAAPPGLEAALVRCGRSSITARCATRAFPCRLINCVRIQGHRRALDQALAAVWTVTAHAMAPGGQRQGRSWRR